MLRDKKNSKGVTLLAGSLLAGAACAFALGAGSSAALAQGATPPDQVYLPNTPMSSPVANCPNISWALAKSADGNVWGYFFYADGSGVSKAAGSIDRSGRFRITLTNLSGNGPVGVATGTRGRQGLLEASSERRGLRQSSHANGPVAAFDGTVRRVAHAGQRTANSDRVISC